MERCQQNIIKLLLMGLSEIRFDGFWLQKSYVLLKWLLSICFRRGSLDFFVSSFSRSLPMCFSFVVVVVPKCTCNKRLRVPSIINHDNSNWLSKLLVAFGKMCMAHFYSSNGFCRQTLGMETINVYNLFI